MADRTVHARSYEIEVVRYDRAGKWYVEPRGNLGDFTGCPPRRHVKVAEAARVAVEECDLIFADKPGGESFDRHVRRIRDKQGR